MRRDLLDAALNFVANFDSVPNNLMTIIFQRCNIVDVEHTILTQHNKGNLSVSNLNATYADPIHKSQRELS